MEIEIYKRKGSTENYESEYLKIISYGIVAEPKSLLLISEGSTEFVEKEPSVPMIEIHKIQFIASCRTKLPDEILVAFYFGEFAALHGYIISDLPSGYSTSNQAHLIDYKSYLEICELTGENKLSLAEYYEQIKSGYIDTNSLVKYKENYLNYDQQQDFYKKLTVEK